ncbi:hypothetical protein H9639_04460 [Arthrobacter sp. Sa2CUA1]|uniref:Uncharacterized protein n=1 Tax=Arthrobacter gallicola TaxID=2762225 RepID=A0ABR8UPT4_9MICC|nr:hypothetical protein [Arthrobacter gallicola]MBD7994543.1 hypothetical protein [Arthrobacter gallicola]
MLTLNQNVIDFVRRYGRVQPQDVAEEFDLGGVQTLRVLTDLEEMGALRLIEGGDGVYAVPNGGQSLCDPFTGTCTI